MRTATAKAPAEGFVRRLSLFLVVLAACSTAAGTERTEETEGALAQLRDRITEASDDEEPLVHEVIVPGPEEPTTPEQTAVLLPPRYRGALPDDNPLVLGVFNLRDSPDPIIDGDTVAVVGLDASLRLIGIDTEEIFHRRRELRTRAFTDFPGYLEIVYGETDGVPKFGTPMGEAAREFARQFFHGDTQVRLELDELTRTRGYFNRYLVHVFALRDGEWFNYNLEAVRAGMTPYFMKYGYSARFHAQFIAAEAEARAQNRGIWDPTLRHYPDYEERLEWWDRRARAITHFREQYGGNPIYVEIGNDQDWYRLPELVGEEIVIVGTLGDFHYDYNPQRIQLSHRIGDDFTIVSFREGHLESLALEQYVGEYVYVRGELGFYREKPQFIAERGLEVWLEP